MNENVVEKIAVTGFDPEQDPYILVMRDGSLQVWFEFMPPFDYEDRDGPFLDHFGEHMQEAIGVAVSWEDRELFVVPAPQADTVARLVKFLATYRQVHPEAWR